MKFEGFDVIGSKIEPSQNIMLKGAPQSGKTTLALQFLFSGLREGGKAVAALTNESPDNFCQRAGRFNLKPEEYARNGTLKFIDAFSKTVGITSHAMTEDDSTVRLDGVFDLTGMVMAASQICSGFLSHDKPVRFVLDTTSSLLLYNSAREVVRFLHVLTGRLKTLGAVGFILLESDIHSPRVIAAVESLCDGTIKLEKTPAGRFIEFSLGPESNIRHELEISTRGFIAGKKVAFNQSSPTRTSIATKER